MTFEEAVKNVAREHDTEQWLREKEGYEIVERIHELEDLVAELEDKLEKTMKLVESAYQEGFGEGVNDVERISGGKIWYDSRSCKRLVEIKGKDA